VVTIIIFFVGLGKLNVNMDKFATGGFFNLLFLISILVLFGILVGFWVKFNLFETLFYLAIATIPALFIGNLALGSLNANDKKIKSE